MGLLRLIEGLLPPEEALRVTPARCLRWRSKSGGCDACARACPADAVALDGEQPVSIDDERCLRCGICIAVCPTEALELPSVSAARLLERAEKEAANGLADGARQCQGRQGGWAGDSFTCTLGPARPEAVSGGTVRLPCLGSLSPSTLATLALRSGRVELLMGEPGCGTCRLKDRGWPALQRAVREAGDILGFFGLAADIRIALPQDTPAQPDGHPAMDSGDVATSRKEFLASLTRGATRLGVGLLPSIFRGDEDDAESPEEGKDGLASAADSDEERVRGRVPEGRTLLLEALRVSGADTAGSGASELARPRLVPAGDSARPGEWALPFGCVQVSSACKGCDVCTRVCPSGALTKAEEAEGGVLLHEPGKCLKCGTCVRTCPRHAIVVEEPLAPAQVLGPARVLVKFRLRACRWCGRIFWSDEQDVCQACQARLEWIRTVLPDAPGSGNPTERSLGS